MYPILFQIGSLQIGMYGVMGVIATITCILMLPRFAKKEGLDPRTVTDAIVFTCFVGFLGARAAQFIVIADEILADPSQAGNLMFSAGPYLGAVIAAIPFGIYWFHRQKIPLLQGLDILALVGALSMGIARWGCFFSGCCFGKPTDLPWGITFPPLARYMHAGLPAVPIHPTQIYLSINSLVIFGLLMLLYKKKRFHGQITTLYLMFYTFTRFFIEYVRGDRGRGYVIEDILSTSQFLGILIFAGAATMLFLLARRHRNSGEPDWEPAKSPAPKTTVPATSHKKKKARSQH